jgi:hypothetical protein
MNSSMSSDSSSDEDSDAEGEAHVDVRTHAPRISFGLAPSGSMGELAQHKTLKAIDAGANRGGRRATTFSVPIVLYDLPAQAKPQVQSQLKHKAKPKPRIATDACHSFRYAHHPNATDNDSDDELALVLDTPFSPSTSGYERDGFCMPVA